MTQCIRSPQVCPSARELNIFPVHDEQPHKLVEEVGSAVGNLGEDIVTGLRVGLLRVGLGVEGVEPSLSKKVPVQTLQFDKLSLHHASGQFNPLSHEQPLHFVVVLVLLVVVVSGSIGEGGAPHDVESQRHVSAVVYLENVRAHDV